ncbi:DNA (cytosine-5)-methyltransferase 1, replication foci domain-containing protein, partial [Cynara cardunculus var. scolymus]
MASSDEEGEIFPHSVTAYQFLNYSNKPIPFSNLPIHWSDHHTGDSPPVYLLGTSDGDRQSVYKQVIGWKLELLHVMPQVYILSKGKSWIKLLKPKKSYEDIIKTVVIVIHGLHFVKRNLEATGDRILSHLMKTLSSYDVVEPLEQYLSNHVSLIRIAVAKDEDLAKSKENQSRKKSKFIVDEDDIASDEDLDEEAEVLFDPVCAFCDNGGDVLPCEGQCLRSFHPTIEAGVDSCCESLGFAGASQYEAIPTLLCDNCKHQKHQCFGCGKLGSSDKCSVAEVFPCVSATCGHFYHPECVASLLCPFDETVSKKLESRIAAGESFTCPIHKCHRCKGGEDKEVHDLQFAVCRRCPRAYHRKCLPMKHKILPSLLTPKRDHLLFPYIVRKRNQDGSRTKVLKVEISKAFGNLEVSETENTSQMVERRYSSVTFRDPAFEKGKSSLMYEKRPSLEENVSISRNPEYPSSRAQKKPAYREERFASKQAVRTALKKLDDGCSVEDAKAVCEPNVLNQLIRWKIVDFCCGSNDFSCFMKEKLDSMGKKCSYKNYDLIVPKSFYLPGSINAQDQTLDDWNTVSPPLSLWSHPDWTAKHQAVAEKHSHIVKQNQHEGGERVVSNYLMEENHDYYRDFSEYRDISTILDDVPEAPAGGSPPASANPSTIDDEDINVIPDTEIHIQETLDDTADMNASSDMDVSSP